MKKYLAFIATILLSLITGVARGQSSPPPQDDVQMRQQPLDDDDAAQQQADNQRANEAADATYDPIAAQQQQQQQQQDVAAQPGVARVSAIRGDVSTQRGDNGEWVAATQNMPIAVGDRVSTGDKSRTELQLDFADTLRLSDRTTVKIANLSRYQIQVQVGQGLATYSVNRGGEATTEIDTPNAAIRPLSGDGEFRILVNSDAETQVIIRRGSRKFPPRRAPLELTRGK